MKKETLGVDGSMEKHDLEFLPDYQEEAVPADVILCSAEHRPQESIQKRSIPTNNGITARGMFRG